MSESQKHQAVAADPVAATGLLDQVLSATKQTEPDRAHDLVRTLIEEANKGTVSFDRQSQPDDRGCGEGDRRDAALSSQLKRGHA